MDAGEVTQRILRFLDAHYRVPPGSMIRLGGLWSCRQCRSDLLTCLPKERRFACDACGSPVGEPVRSLPACCRNRFRVASGDLYDSDHFLEEEDLAAALCAECARILPIALEAGTAAEIEPPRREPTPRDLPALVEAYSGPASEGVRGQIEEAIRKIIAAAPADPPPVPPEVAERMRRRIADLRDPWPQSVAKDHGALPLHSSEALYLWSIRPDGTLLRSDLDTALNTTEPCDQPLTRFAMMLRGIRSYPELSEFLHPPRGCAPCRLCLATGRGKEFSCGRCGGLGWVSP